MAQDSIKRALEVRLDELRARLASIKLDVTRAHSGDAAEQAQERENDEVVDAIGHETARSIREIQAALERVEAGTYGACERCGEDISPARLAAMPEAVRCVGCADRV